LVQEQSGNPGWLTEETVHPDINNNNSKVDPLRQRLALKNNYTVFKQKFTALISMNRVAAP
jgi:hypothetical protein